MRELLLGVWGALEFCFFALFTKRFWVMALPIFLATYVFYLVIWTFATF